VIETLSALEQTVPDNVPEPESSRRDHDKDNRESGSFLILGGGSNALW